MTSMMTVTESMFNPHACMYPRILMTIKRRLMKTQDTVSGSTMSNAMTMKQTSKVKETFRMASLSMDLYCSTFKKSSLYAKI